MLVQSYITELDLATRVHWVSDFNTLLLGSRLVAHWRWTPWLAPDLAALVTQTSHRAIARVRRLVHVEVAVLVATSHRSILLLRAAAAAVIHSGRVDVFCGLRGWNVQLLQQQTKDGLIEMLTILF